jgi:hypothetical protein
MFGFEFNGKPLIPTKHALDEMEHADIDMYRAAEMLTEGFDCERSKRGKNILERCLRRGNKMLKVVVADVGSYYKIIHAGIFSDKRRFSHKENEGSQTG